ncbi:MAG: hypothetical protein E6I11_16755 [Chloroflexi bacterium]|nr:MAG: hypothetical protein E6I17_08215 [Chloroflexota bacterium]TMF81436.1 MAG: hypothetical protein E6I11_16755 [Chloroflexota bacterium]
MRKRYSFAAATILAGTVMLGGAPAVSASNPSCTARFTSTLAPVAIPFGTNIVEPEVRNLSLGGPNLGQEVKVLFATADKNACPVSG